MSTDDAEFPVVDYLDDYLRWYAERFGRHFPECPINPVHWDACGERDQQHLLRSAALLGLTLHFGDERPAEEQ